MGVVVEGHGHGLALGILLHGGVGQGNTFLREVAGIGESAINVGAANAIVGAVKHRAGTADKLRTIVEHLCIVGDGC